MAKLAFPNPVDEVSARITAGGVVLLAVLALVTGSTALMLLLTVGFLLRVISGPNLSPLALFVTRIVRPRLDIDPKLTAGPPKRFAQGIGLVFTGSASVLALGGSITAARFVLGGLVVAALLESVFGLCLGCKAFALLMRIGVIPAEVCERCNNINLSPAD